MTLYKKNILFTLLFLVFSATAIAQTAKTGVTAPNPEEEKIKTTIKEFAAAYSSIHTTKDRAAVMKHVSKEVSSTLIDYDIRDRVRVMQSNYDGFNSYLERVIKDSMTTNYVISSFLRTVVKDNFGVAVCIADYNTTKDKAIWSKGTETVTFSLHKVDNVWKIINYAVVDIEDIKQRGSCVCELFKSNIDATVGHYVVKTTVPSGKAYTTTMTNFEFAKNPSNRLITVDNVVFKWLPNGELWLLKDGKTEAGATKIGKAHPEDEFDVIMTLIKSHLFVGNCATTVIKGAKQ
ncbi:MAG: hypothetical protein EAZ57_11745 [Cytophagales bacterium]|nr:MAG: hypothetical protein EAZ67_12795 [Cytophagales bacterium]TAF59264.1 MAG: hypothetical protein EAZ57_11745 [Cytophagales bacterium]